MTIIPCQFRLHSICVAVLCPVLGLCGSNAGAQSASASAMQEETTAIEPVRTPWTLKFEPSAWYVAANGTARLPGSASAGNGQSFEVADLNLDSPRLMPAGELMLRRGDWRFRIMASGLDVDDRGVSASSPGQVGDVPFGSGDTLRSSLEVMTLAADAEFAFHTYNSEPGSVPITSTVFALGGIRAIDAEISSQVVSGGSAVGTASGDALHAHPYAGVRWELVLARDFTIDLTTSIGGLSFGDGESWSSDILVGFQWNPTEHFGLQAGYRQLLFGIETDEAPTEFAWQGGLAGVYAGATLRF